ncbi:MAG: TonB-dependent receptor [Terriglobales bacterium]
MRSYFLFLAVLIIGVLCILPAGAQGPTGAISGVVTDPSHAVLPGAAVKVEPGPINVVTNAQGQFTIANLTPGDYTITVNYVGFSPATTSVTVAAGQVASLNSVLNVSSESENIIVTAERAHGEAEAINETRTSDNILNVLPAEVIRSLPNANVADAVGRLPGVTLERDEGEGKYVQIRGTEPRLSNLTIDGVEVPSPEGGIRQVKLDIVPADLIETVQINKTLQANQDGDAVGGSVNLVTKTASDRPTLSLYGNGGFTPIIKTVPLSEFGLTAGKRFGAQKRLGILASGSYDYNGRGINDIEPSPTVFPGSFAPEYTATDLRLYKYNRNRFGFGVSADYKLGESSVVYLRGLFSDFKDSGRRWVYSLANNDPALVAIGQGGGTPSFNTEIRDGHYQVGSVLLGGTHVFTKYYGNWGLSVSRSRMFNPINGGESVDSFTYAPPGTDPVNNPPTSNCQYDPTATKSFYRPQWTSPCYTEAYNPANFQLAQIEVASHGQSSQLNLQGQGSVGRLYQLHAHPSRFEMGFRIRNAHKFDDSYETFFLPNAGVNLPLSMFLSGLTDKNYYDHSYPFGPLGSWDKINAYFKANPGNFSPDTTSGNSNTYGTNPANFDLVERITSGYLMSSIDFNRFTLTTGVRFEGTRVNTLSVDTTLAKPCLCAKGASSYVDVLPSASLRFRVNDNSGIRLVYGRGLSRPLPQELTTAVSIDTGTSPSTYHIGNVLKPAHANNYDLLYERYLTPLGLIQVGFFYKDITDPIVTNVTTPTTGPYAGFFLAQPANAGSAYVQGVEFAFQQHFTYLPGLLSGLGVSANYSYTSSGTRKVDQLRSDNPALLRQAPNTWNLSPTYDRGRLSMRVGMAYNGPNIFQYQYHDLTLNPDGSKSSTPPDGGIKGPNGDSYLYGHFQVDAQGSYYLGKGLTAVVSGLNLNNEVFGFYNGSPQFVVQREYYKPTYTFGFRWDLHHE